MTNHNMIIPIFQSHSGEFILMEEKLNDNTDLYFALQLSNNYRKEYLLNEREKKDQLQKSSQIRQFLKMIEDRNKYYLFKYVQGNTIQYFIDINRTQQYTIDQEIIDAYVIQILDALFELHQLNILGRIFSVENIINNNGTLVLMDFGYGPDLKQDQMNILAPPEVIKELVNKNHEISNKKQSVLKIDSWLLGAFLYHLVKLRPINTNENINHTNKMHIFKYSDLFKYHNYLEDQIKINTHINAQTKRYNQTLINFIHGLLTYNQQKRLSFLDIYQSEYIKSLNLPKQQQYIQFYTNFNENEIIDNLMIRDGISQSFLLNTLNLNSVNQWQEHNKNQNQQSYDLNITSPLEEVDSLIIHQEENSDEFEGRHLQLPYAASQIQDSKYYDIWIQINIEQFRYFILNNTANQIQSEYPQESYKLSLIIQYALKKQSYFVLKDLLCKLKSAEYPWKNDNITNWNNFKEENKYKFLKHGLIDAIKILIDSMAKIQKELSENQVEIQQFLNKLNNNKDLNNVVNNIINENIYFDQIQNQPLLDLFQVQQLQYKQENELNQQNINDNQDNKQLINSENKNQSIKDNQQDKQFLGYKILINDLYQYFKKDVNNPNHKQKYSQIILKLLYCRLIKIIFSLENMKKNFKNIKRSDQQIVTPNDIYDYIESQDNYEQKYQEIEELLKKYFPQQ